jgi:hypothetical protein
MADVRTKTLARLREGRVTVLAAHTPPGATRPGYVEAHVTSSQPGTRDLCHRVVLEDGAWSCSCRADGCPHSAAVQLVTGWPSPAARRGAA